MPCQRASIQASPNSESFADTSTMKYGVASGPGLEDGDKENRSNAAGSGVYHVAAYFARLT